MRKNLGEVNFDLALVPAAPLAWRPTQTIVRSLWPVPRHKHVPVRLRLRGPRQVSISPSVVSEARGGKACTKRGVFARFRFNDLKEAARVFGGCGRYAD
jgi:hypothetical protein